MISYDKISLHSSICLKPTSQIIKLTNSNYHYQVQYRLSKLKTAMESIAYSNPSPPMDRQGQMLQLISSANNLVQLIEPSIPSIDKITDISSNLRRASENISPCILVYSERLRSLALEKTYAFLEYLNANKEKDSINIFINTKNKELREVKNKIESYNKKSAHLQKILKTYENIDEIKSMIESSKTFNSSVISPDAEENGIKAEMEELDNMILTNRQEITQKSVDDLKKYFYSKCLLVKLSFPSRHQAQYIQIPELYEKIQKIEVPLEQWEGFIRDEFSHPERWVNLKVIPIYNNPNKKYPISYR